MSQLRGFEQIAHLPVRQHLNERLIAFWFAGDERWMWSDSGEEIFLKLSRHVRAEVYGRKFELLQIFVQFGALAISRSWRSAT
ncbi:MAG: hypothetical protein QOF74_6963 [Caballeronia mineralivorans]|nr:hypothetical protein [Caballeronia mineralivorans]